MHKMSKIYGCSGINQFYSSLADQRFNLNKQVCHIRVLGANPSQFRESFGEQKKSIETEAKDICHAAHLDGAVAQHPLHHAYADDGAAGGRPSENTGTPGKHPG